MKKLLIAVLLALNVVTCAYAAAPAQLDINTATITELKAVPGIGDVTAAKIVAGRPYGDKSQLVSKKVVAPALYAKVKNQLIAKKTK